MKNFSSLIILCALVVAVPDVSGGQRLAVRVSPTMAFAPASVTVRTTVVPSDDNRMLSIALDSPTYHRSSEIPLDGRNAPRENLLSVSGLPTGLYEVRAVLLGPAGPIAETIKVVRVEPSAGNTH